MIFCLLQRLNKQSTHRERWIEIEIDIKRKENSCLIVVPKCLPHYALNITITGNIEHGSESEEEEEEEEFHEF